MGVKLRVDSLAKKQRSLAEAEKAIGDRILLVRGVRILVDADLAKIFGVTTKRLNEQVKRNKDRFPEDFVFQLTDEEKAEVVANCDHLDRLKFSPVPPHAFTEFGAIMAANVLDLPEPTAPVIKVSPRSSIARSLRIGGRRSSSMVGISNYTIRQTMDIPERLL